MEIYVSSFQPEISVSAGAEDIYSDFLDGRETQFLEAVGEYVYSIYDDLVSIAELHSWVRFLQITEELLVLTPSLKALEEEIKPLTPAELFALCRESLL